MKNKMWVVGLVVVVATGGFHGCASYDYERASIENSVSVNNGILVDDLEREALENKKPGDMATYKQGSFSYQVTPFMTRYDQRTGKQCRDYRTDYFLSLGEQKSASKTACRYNGQWYVVSIDGKSMIHMTQPMGGYAGNWYMNQNPMAVLQYRNRMFGGGYGGFGGYGGTGYYGGRGGIGGSVYFNGRW